MERIILKLFEFYNLHEELNGISSADGKTMLTHGLLKEKLSIVTKYWINELAKKVAVEKEAIDSLKDELVRKYGKENENGIISVNMFLEEETVNPNYLLLQKEFSTLLETEKELEYKPLKLSDFENLKTENNYAIFYKLILPE